jgi:hypothetical protein
VVKQPTHIFAEYENFCGDVVDCAAVAGYSSSNVPPSDHASSDHAEYMRLEGRGNLILGGWMEQFHE